tara:strand:- start:75841 stop:76125 length:285 start_codon:yes stop_codon:yes gene_type:complete
MAQTITIPILRTESDIKSLVFPNDVQLGLYLWNHAKGRPILMASETHIVIAMELDLCGRFATRKEIMEFRLLKETNYPTIIGDRAYDLASVIYF